MSDQLATLRAEYERVCADMVANFNRPTGGRGKRGLRSTDAAIRRGASYAAEIRRLQSAIRAAGGEVPGFPSERPAPAPRRAPVPVPAGPGDPRVMTLEELAAEDEALEAERRASGARMISDRHRSIKAELGGRNAARRAAENRSRAAKKAAATRARRKAAGLPPLYIERDPFRPPAGGWTDADRV